MSITEVAKKAGRQGGRSVIKAKAACQMQEKLWGWGTADQIIVGKGNEEVLIGPT